MEKIRLNNIEYELIEDQNGFELEEIKKKCTDYFVPFDYIIGDWSYGKLRLKGFCEKQNPIHKKENHISRKEQYIKENCAYGCKYFVLKKKSLQER